MPKGISPKTTEVDGEKYVSVTSLVEQIDRAVPQVAMHGLLLGDEQFSLGMIEGLQAVKQVIERA